MLDHLVISQVKTLKEALYDTIHGYKLGAKHIAERLNMTQSYLYRAATEDPDTGGSDASGVRFPAKQIVPLISLTDDYQVLDVMEYQVGRVAIKLPKSTSSKPDEILAASLVSAVEFGEFVKEVHESLKDGQIKPDEQQRIDKEGVEAIQSILSLMSQYKGR